MGLYTKDGRPLQVSGDKIYSRSGTIIGRIKGNKVYGPEGRYVGTIVDDRLVYRSSQSGTLSSSFSAANRAGSGLASRAGSGLLISLCALSLLPLQATSPDEWHRAANGSGVEYRWTAGIFGCNTEFRDSATANTSRTTEITGVIDYERPLFNGIEHNALYTFQLTVYGFGSSVGPDVGCQQINNVTIQELKRSAA